MTLIRTIALQLKEELFSILMGLFLFIYGPIDFAFYFFALTFLMDFFFHFEKAHWKQHVLAFFQKIVVYSILLYLSKGLANFFWEGSDFRSFIFFVGFTSNALRILDTMMVLNPENIVLRIVGVKMRRKLTKKLEDWEKEGGESDEKKEN